MKVTLSNETDDYAEPGPTAVDRVIAFSLFVSSVSFVIATLESLIGVTVGMIDTLCMLVSMSVAFLGGAYDILIGNRKEA